MKHRKIIGTIGHVDFGISSVKEVINASPNIMIVKPGSKKPIAAPPTSVIGLTVTPNSKDYWNLPLNPEKKALVIDDTKIVNLGTACEKTLMYHFEGDPPRKWEIASQFSKPK